MRSFMSFLFLILCTAQANAANISTSQGTLTVTPVVTGLNEPWSLGFLPDGGILLTERGGRLLFVHADGTKQTVAGIPQVVANGQGGLLDVLVLSDFADTREIMLSFSMRQGRGAGTALVIGRLSNGGDVLENVRLVFQMLPGSSGGRHFGSRIVEGRDGKIYLTIGERGDRPAAQDLSRHNGSIIRINRDGTVPADNPFVGQAGALPEIWSYGHRNPQGAALDLNGRLWVNEHGARGGDEVNLIIKGANYGWPVIAYGRHYSGAKIGEGTAREGMEQPAHYWDPSIAPSGMMIYSGKLWPDWRGAVFVGSLKFNYLGRLDPNDGWAEERIQSADTGRVRDVREAPDGTIWYLSVGNGAAYRISP